MSAIAQLDSDRSRGTRKKGSHATLLYDASKEHAPPRSSRSGHFDVVVVPASRGADALDGAAHLAARLDVPLVVLCSRGANFTEVAAHLGRIRGCRALVIDLRRDYQLDILPMATAAPRFLKADGDRDNDVALKRNLGLLLARLLGWGKILFLDDDIIRRSILGRTVGVSFSTVRRTAAQLNVSQIAGLTCRNYPDNSVVCHARRLAGFHQENFVSGAALGVNCHDRPIPFFPGLYNEDWFFFSRVAAGRELRCVGDAHQAPYDPFDTPERARQEEFGDLVAEGLYGLFEDQPPEMKYFFRLREANERYWERFIEDRQADFDRTTADLQSMLDRGEGDAGRISAAINSIKAAGGQLSTLAPALCVDFLHSWVSDLDEWETATQRIRSVRYTADALSELGLTRWEAVRMPTTPRGQVQSRW